MLKTIALAIGAAAVLAILAFGVLRLTGFWDRLLPPAPFQTVDFATLEPPDKPNRYLLCPPGLCERTSPDATSPVFPVPVARLRDAFRALLAVEPSVVVDVNEDDTLDLVQRTSLMRFPDRITVEFVPIGADQSTLAIYSRSTYGYSDMGANERRITAWLDRLAVMLE